jgi:hypothetical protein
MAARILALSTIPHEERGRIQSKLRTTITDALGTETLSSIDEFSPPLFPDTTTRVRVAYHGRYDSPLPDLQMTVSFHTNRLFNDVDIEYEGVNAREVATGLCEGVLQCVRTSPAHNAWINPPLPWSALISIATGVVFVLVGMLATTLPLGITAVLGALLLLMYFFWSVGPKLKPYTVFDSDQANRNARAWDWTIKGLAGFIIFGTAMTLVRERLFSLFVWP